MQRLVAMAGSFCLLSIASLVLLAAEATPDDGPADTQAALMRAKLASTQRIVEGLVSQDFDLLYDGAEQLRRITDATAWESHQDQVYEHYRGELRRVALKLKLQAEERNLEGASFTYMHGLMTCVNCHSHCRDVLRIVREAPRLGAVPDASPLRAPSTRIVR
jgi:hypothetical protein